MKYNQYNVKVMSNLQETSVCSTNLAFLFRSLKNPLFNRTFGYQSVHSYLSSLTQAMGTVHGLYREKVNFDCIKGWLLNIVKTSFKSRFSHQHPTQT